MGEWRDIPIIVSGPLVPRVLDGSKTVTRRVGKTWARARKGDRLWVRETHGWCAHCGSIGFRADGRMTVACERGGGNDCNVRKWKPSIHMPRHASRCTLRIVSIRSERLHEITERDVHREGIPLVALRHEDEPERVPAGKMIVLTPVTHWELAKERGPVVAQFALLWDRLHGAGAWKRNPAVWRIAFRRET